MSAARSAARCGRWWTHPSDSTVDVAVVPFGPPPDVPFQFSAFPTEAFAIEERDTEKRKLASAMKYSLRVCLRTTSEINRICR